MNRKVLIVEDSAMERKVLERIVADAGYTALAVESGVQALTSAKAHKPDVILMDINMPDMDGFAATRQLKEDEATKHIPVVFVTGKNQKADIAWGRLLGARGYVTKPYSRQQILDQLRDQANPEEV